MEYSVYKLSDNFDLTQYKNTRFMFNPNNDKLILGSKNDDVVQNTHSDLYYEVFQTNKGFDQWLKGWIGFGGGYRNGIIHFTPMIEQDQNERVSDAIYLIEALTKHGFNQNTKIRSLCSYGEYKLKDMTIVLSSPVVNESIDDWLFGSKVKEKVFKIAEGVYTTDELKARYHNSDLKPYLLRIECPKVLKGKLTESFNKLSQKGFDGIIMGKTFRVFNEAKQVREANAQKDNEVREKVRSIFFSLVKSIKNNPDVGSIVGTENGYGYFINLTQGLKYFYPEYNSKPLYVLIKSADKNYSSYNKKDDYNIIIMNILSEKQMMDMATKQESGKKSVINQFIKKTIIPVLTNEANSFIHEFIHAIDDVRLKNYKGRKESQLNLNNTEYLSDPLEFNAWFQSNMYDFDKDANNEPALKKDWKSFYAYVLDCLPFVKEYNEKYRRKFDVRLWKYWNEFIKEGSKKQVNESLKNEGGFFITNSGRDILNLLQNKPKEYRIVYDSNLGLFMICDANEGIHADMLEKAYKNGLYYNLDKFIDSLGSFQNYIETGQDGGWDENDNEINSFLYYMVFDPTGQWEVGDDDYDTIYKLPFGNLFTRKCDLSEIPFYNMLPLTEQLNEAVNPKLNDNFWKWFGKSVCRDKQGNPIVFYHGTPNADLPELRGGTYFTQNKDYADGYQDQFASMLTRKKEARKPGTYAVYLKIENPFDTRKKKCRDEFYKYYYQQMGSGTDLQESGLPDWTDGRDLLEFLTEYHPELGYDGLLLDEGGHYDIHGGLVYRGISYLPLSSNQIKSVDNNGNWSTTSNNIYESYDYIDNIEVIINPTKKEFDDFVKKNKWYRILLTNDSIAIWSADTPLLHYQVENEYNVTGTTLFCHKGNVYFQDWDLVDVEDDMKEYYIEQAEKLDNNSILKQYFPNIHMKQDTIDMLSGKKVIYESKEPNLNQNFWKWFGDSVCVDDIGAPLVLYHGTSSEFTKFKKGFIFTTDNEQVADGYGYYGAMPVFVRIRKPFIVDAFNQDWQKIYNAEGFKKKYKELTDEDIEKLYKAYEYFESLDDAKEYYEESKKYNPDDYINLARAYGQKPLSTTQWAQYAKNKGYDGCIIKNVVDGFSLSDCLDPINEYIIWNPEQVKSVNNNGEWSDSDELMEQK